MLIYPILVIAVFVGCLYFLWSRRKLIRLFFHLPGPLGFPLADSQLDFFDTALPSFKSTSLFYINGSTSLFILALKPIIITRDPDIAKDFLTSSQCLNRPEVANKEIGEFFDVGILSLKEPIWNERRKHINVSFKMNVLLSFLPIFNAETKSLISLMDTFVDQGEINILSDILRWSFKIANQTIFDTDVEQYAEFQNNEILHFARLYSMTTILNIYQPLRRNNFISNIFGFGKEKAELFEKIDTFLEKVIGAKLNSNPEKCSDSSNNTVINLLIDLYRNGKMDYIDLKGECVGLLIASYETTAFTVTHSLILLAMFPEYQDLVYEELTRVFPSSGPIDVTNEDLQKLEYMDRVFNEILRLLPTVPSVPRELKGDIRLSNGNLIPKGVTVLIDVFNLHRNKDLWGPDADIFNPNNFLPDNMRDRHPSAFMPFGKGRRNCIGSRYAPIPLKIALAMIFWKYKLSTNFRYEDLEYIQGVPIFLKEIPLLNFQKRF